MLASRSFIRDGLACNFTVWELVSMTRDNRTTWTDPTGHTWILPSFKTKLQPWKRTKHKAISDFVYARDGSKCQRCGATRYLNIDHIIPRRARGTNHPNNLQLLCSSCHGEKTGEESHQWPMNIYPTFKQQRMYGGRGMF